MGIDLELARMARRLQIKIAIDGPAGAGKSTVGQGIARALDCPYVDTGLMYRAVSAVALAVGTSLEDGERLAEIARSLNFSLATDGELSLLIDGATPSAKLHSPPVDEAVSVVAAHPSVRRILVRQQRALASGIPMVMIGRDIGTVVLPDACVKLWVTASLEERSRRRRAERQLEKSGQETTTNLDKRDGIDATRSVSPALPADDAIVLETDGLSRDAVLSAALGRVREAIRNSSSSTAAGRDADRW